MERGLLAARAVQFAGRLLCGTLTLASVPVFAHTLPLSGLWIELEQEGRRFRVVVTSPRAAEYVRRYVAGEAPGRALLGEVVAGGRHNEPWSWHLDPNSVSFGREDGDSCRATVDRLELREARRRAGELTGEAPREAARRECFRRARIKAAFACDFRGCAKLRGLYAGRSPFAPAR